MAPVYAAIRGPEYALSHSGCAAKWLQWLPFLP